ncbi:hypothetical protein [Bdellovibrio sp. HCB337]|uniref:hypothetical protein n=1 Tax=Bdellovibrio sp. HCB337 TaxID=3394358 RepID=UPI0039A42925
MNATPFNFPQDFIKTLEDDLGQKIEIQRVKNWDELQAKMVTKTGAHLVLAPSFWARDMDRESLIMRLNPIQTKVEKRISPDFISLQGKNLNALPLYWAVTDFRVHKDSTLGDSLDQALQNKALTEIHLYPDQDLMVTHLKVWAKSPAGSLKLKDVSTFQFNKIPTDISKTAIWEYPHLVKDPNTRSLTTGNSRAFMVYSMMIPRNSSNKKLSYRLIEKMMDPQIEEAILTKLPMGSTLQVTDSFQIAKEKRSTELRDLKLHELIILEKRLPDLFQEYWQKYNFILPN